MYEYDVYGFGPILRHYLEYHRISQSEFADRLGVTQKHINSIINGNIDISEDLILAIALVTDIEVKYIMGAEEEKKIHRYLRKKYKTEKEVNEYLNSFHIKELAEKNWVTFKDIVSPVQNTIDLLEFLNIRNFEVLNNFSNKNILYKKKEDADDIKVALWIARCDKLARKQEINDYKKENFSVLIEEIKKLSLEAINPEKLIQLFNKYGMYLVIEEPLKGTKINGCTKVKINTPAIYLTNLYKDKASFYFALFHELGHVKSDYNMAKSKVIIDLLEDKEKRADNFALNTMVPNEIFEEIKKDYKNVEEICSKYSIPVCFGVERLAKEGIISYRSKLYNTYKESI